MDLTIDCDKHGQNQKALPIIDGTVPHWTEWPKNVQDYPRVCVKCLAAAMVNPIRCGGLDYAPLRT